MKEGCKECEAQERGNRGERWGDREEKGTSCWRWWTEGCMEATGIMQCVTPQPMGGIETGSGVVKLLSVTRFRECGQWRDHRLGHGLVIFSFLFI